LLSLNSCRLSYLFDKDRRYNAMGSSLRFYKHEDGFKIRGGRMD